MRGLIIFIIVLVFLGALGIAIYAFAGGHEALAVFLVRVVLAFGTLSAVLTALFGDALREKVDPIRVEIEIPEEPNNVYDKCELDGRIYHVYCHHLRVKNVTGHRPIKECRVWLERMFDQGPDGRWEEKTRFAVPRLMEWAPFEYSEDKRTFSTYQVFDFGKTLSENGGFELTIYRKQGGTFPRRSLVGEKRRFVFYVTADNYQRKELFCFEVTVPASTQTRPVTPVQVTRVEKKDWKPNS